MSLFGVKPRKLPIAIIANSEEVANLYKYRGNEYNAETLSLFATKWKSGKLKMYKGKTSLRKGHVGEHKLNGGTIRIDSEIGA